MASTPFNHQVQRVGSKVHNAAVIAGKVKTVIDAARWAYPYVRAGAALAAPLIGL